METLDYFLFAFESFFYVETEQRIGEALRWSMGRLTGGGAVVGATAASRVLLGRTWLAWRWPVVV